jgi:DNA-nicking Smr family endonuclease
MFSAMAKKTPAKKAKAPAPVADASFRPFAKLAAEKKAAAAKAAKAPAKAEKAPAAKHETKRSHAHAHAPRADEGAPSEAETFAMYMAGVEALGGAATRIPRTQSRVERAERGAAPAEDPDAAARATMRALVTEGLRFDVSDDGRLVEGRRLDVDPRELRRLRTGAYAVDGAIDLHGLSALEAREALEAFLKKRRAEGDRVVRVVHGKGNHSPRGVSILRGEIGAWLSQGRAAREVAAFVSSPDDDGHSGSLLVLLAR